MISMAELNLRAAKDSWDKAKAAWQQSLKDVNEAKVEWEKAQAEFYGNVQVMSSAASCGSCTGCSTGK